MATFIPEHLNRLSARHLHIKRVLNELDESYIIRTPINLSEWTPDFFVSHPDSGWLAMVVDDTSFTDLEQAQLFSSETSAAFEQSLDHFRDLKGFAPSLNRRLSKLVLLWSCNKEETRDIASRYLASHGLHFLSKEKFLELGARYVPRLLSPLNEEDSQTLLGHFFPEVEIPAGATTRRYFQRDNSAKLTRFFLDTEQELITKLDLEPPQEQTQLEHDLAVRLVNGVAGSGKTLIALSRALLLAEKFPQQQVLLLIHNTPIVADIKNRLYQTHEKIPNNLEMSTFFAWIYQQWRALFQAVPKMPEDSRQIIEFVRHYRLRWPNLKASDTQLVEELDYINESLITDQAQYLSMNRSGRGFALRPKERSQIWNLYQSVTTALSNEGLRMWSQLPADICLAKDPSRLAKYRHILIDEAQFFAPSWFQAIKLSLESGGHLFLCADPQQGFMKSRLSWKSVGLDVKGKTRKLHRSYRTTRAILAAANSILSQFISNDSEDFLEPDFTGMEEGQRPFLIYTDSPQDSVDRLVNELIAITKETKLPLASLLLIYGDNVQKQLLYDRLSQQFGAHKIWWLNKKENKKTPPQGYNRDYLRMAYLDTATGLEASIVFLIGIERLFTQWDRPSLTEAEQNSEREENARKLYMAMTRAGQRLVLISAEKLPREVEDILSR